VSEETTTDGHLRFDVLATCGEARRGRIVTAHSTIETPVFMPVGTVGAVKALTSDQVDGLGARIILGNSYHLYLRPGLDVLRAAGGLHELMGWSHSILTDSGGYQIFSLKNLRELDDDGVEFQSHIDGSRHRFTPERVMEIQAAIGSDIAMCLDDCPALPCDESRLDESMARTTAWARRCLAVERPAHQNLFAIVQGGLDVERRLRHLETLAGLPFQGLALGGLSVGESAEEMYATVEAVAPQMPSERPRYLMGVGTPEDLVECVARGIDMFDCVLPTRNARMGTLYTWDGRVNITRAEFKDDMTPLDPKGKSAVSQTVSRAYLRHLMKAKEITGLVLGTLQNLSFYGELMEAVRVAIREGTLDALRSRIASAPNRW